MEAARVAGPGEAGVGTLTPSAITAPSGCRYVNTFHSNSHHITERIKRPEQEVDAIPGMV